MAQHRVVVLLDMDCFFAQVEQRRRPELWGKPVGVVQHSTGGQGGLIAVSYEARAFGVKRGQTALEAKKLCPELEATYVPQSSVVDKPDISRYRAASNEVFDILTSYFAPVAKVVVEKASVDEAYLDLTTFADQRVTDAGSPDLLVQELLLCLENDLATTYLADGQDLEQSAHPKEESRTEQQEEEGVVPETPSPSKSTANVEQRKYDRMERLKHWLECGVLQSPINLRLAVVALEMERLRKMIRERTQFSCSAGIATSKTMAKLVCARHKPRQQTVAPPDCYDVVVMFYRKTSNIITKILERTPIDDVRGLGGKLGRLLGAELGISTMGELTMVDERRLRAVLGNPSTAEWLAALAKGSCSEPVRARIAPQSLAVAKKFPGKRTLTKTSDAKKWLGDLCAALALRLEEDRSENSRNPRSLTVGTDVGTRAGRLAANALLDESSGATSSLSDRIFVAAWPLLQTMRDSSDEDDEIWRPPILYMSIGMSHFEPAMEKEQKIMRRWVARDALTAIESASTRRDAQAQAERNSVAALLDVDGKRALHGVRWPPGHDDKRIEEVAQERGQAAEARIERREAQQRATIAAAESRNVVALLSSTSKPGPPKTSMGWLVPDREDQMDAEVLRALPPDIRAEILHRSRLESAKRSTPAVSAEPTTTTNPKSVPTTRKRKGQQPQQQQQQSAVLPKNQPSIRTFFGK